MLWPIRWVTVGVDAFVLRGPLPSHGRRQGGGVHEARPVSHPAEPPRAMPTRRISSSISGRRSRCGRCCWKRTSRTRYSDRSSGSSARSTCRTSSAPARRIAAAPKKPSREVIAALQAGENVILWPSGRLSRDGSEKLGGARTAADVLAAVPERHGRARPDARALRQHVQLGRRAARSSGTSLAKAIGLWLANLMVFAPRRRVTVTLEAFTPDRSARADARGDQPLARRVVQRRHSARDADVRSASLPLRPADARVPAAARRRPSSI